MVVDFDRDRGRDDEATAGVTSFENPGLAASMDSKAALATPNGIVMLASGAISFTGETLDSSRASVVLDPPVSCVASTGVGEGGTTDSDFFLPPPPKKLFRVCCFPLNSSRNFVAKRGGSEAVRGGSEGYNGAVAVGLFGGLS
jgi:hypothetical protein